MEAKSIASLSLFAELSAEEREEVANKMKYRQLPKGELLFRAREPAEAMYVVAEGSLSLMREGPAGPQLLAAIGTGELVGEKEFLTGGSYLLSAEAASEAQLWYLDRQGLEELMEGHPNLGLKLSLALGARVVGLEKYLLQHRLRRAPLLRGLPQEVLRAIASRLTLETYRQGEMVYRAADSPKALYLIERGEVRVISEMGRKPGSFVELAPGDVFGHSDLLENRPRTGRAQGLSQVALWCLARRDFNELSTRHPSLKAALSRPLTEDGPSPARELFLEEELPKLPLFAGLSGEEVRSIAQRLRPLTCQAGELVCVRGARGRAMYFIESGEAAILAGDRSSRLETSTLRPGDFFGQVALLTDGTYRTTVRATTDIRLWALDKEAFDEMLLKHPLLALSLSRSGPAGDRDQEPSAPAGAISPPGSLRSFIGRSRANQALFAAMLILLLWLIAVSGPLTATSRLRKARPSEPAPTLLPREEAPPTRAAMPETPTLPPPSPIAVQRSPTVFLALPLAAHDSFLVTITPLPPGQTTVGDLRLRAGPGLGFAVRGYLDKGEGLWLAGRSADSSWLKVQTMKGLEGWVSAQFVETSLPLRELPVLTPSP